MNKHTLHINQRELTAYLPAQHRPDAPTLLVFPDSPAEANALAALLPDYIALLALPEANWEHAFTPWHAPKLFAKGADFGGGADATLQQLTATILPTAERELGLQPQWRGLLGYSLAGLFALYTPPTAAIFSSASPAFQAAYGLTAGQISPLRTRPTPCRKPCISRWATKKRKATTRAWQPYKPPPKPCSPNGSNTPAPARWKSTQADILTTCRNG